MKKVAYLGPEASFTHLATKHIFPTEQLVPMRTIPECIEAVTEGRTELAVVPVENALEGTVPLTIDYLYHEAHVYIQAEILAPIAQHLMVYPDRKNAWDQVERIYSHPHALAQCHKYLSYRLPHVETEAYSSTAAAAKLCADQPELNIAAIANETAAHAYGLTIVERDIHDFHFNHTRFLVVGPKNQQIDAEKHQPQIKTTWMLKLPVDDRPGLLHQVLSVFAWRRLNLSKIESRPLKTGLGHYFFIVDILEQEDHIMMKGAVEELTFLGCTVKNLGSYYTYETTTE